METTTVEYGLKPKGEKIKLSKWRTFILSIKDWLNEWDIFYSSELSYKNFLSNLDNQLSKYKVASNFETQYQYIFLSAIQGIEQEGRWNLTFDSDEEAKKVVSMIVESIKLNDIEVKGIQHGRTVDITKRENK